MKKEGSSMPYSPQLFVYVELMYKTFFARGTTIFFFIALISLN
jgi:hypothetical protein